MAKLLKRIFLLLICLWVLPSYAQTASPGDPSPLLSQSPSSAPTETPTLTLTLVPTSTPTLTATLEATLTPTITPTFAPPTDTPAPTATTAPVFPIRPGSIEGNINDAFSSARYSFDANRDDSVTIRMETTSGDLDPFLSLYGPDGTLVGRNDDEASGNRNSLIALTLADGGTYTIEATRFAEGSSTGTFRLTLAIAGTQSTQTPTDPLSAGPDFAVQYIALDYGDIVYANTLNATTPRRYFAVGGRQGDLVRVVVNSTGDLLPQTRILNRNSEALSRESEMRPGEIIAYATLPETGWYLIEVTARSGAGTFDLFVNRLASAVLQVGELINGTFTLDVPVVSYIVNARIGDQIAVNMFTERGSGVQPQLVLRDLNQTPIANPVVGERFPVLRILSIPRTGPYILEASNLNADAQGDFSLRLTSYPADIERLEALPVSYNKDYPDTISDDVPQRYYHFSGKTGDLVTITMNRETGSLDPYLILMDSDLNELAANNDASINTRNARIIQFRLPKDGDYYVLAARNNLAQGTTQGEFNLALTVGAISLESGTVTATLRWSSGADLNLFVRDPLGRSISWSDPSSPSGGTLQIDSNTGCQTPSAEPVEHIYFPGTNLVTGDYEVWVWYQDGCGRENPANFSLVIDVSGESVLETSGELRPRQRFEAGLRMTQDGETGITNPGRVTTPTRQQEASEGGDVFIRYGESLTGTISDAQYALFYQFDGTAGDEVMIRVERLTNNLDSIVVLRDADNRNLPNGSNDDTDPGTHDSLLTYTLPNTGEYVIAVTRFGVRDGTTTGNFRLTLEQTNGEQ
jgi:hypothetical protein